MISLDDFEALKRKVAKVEKMANKASGALEQILARLKKEYRCSSIKEGQRLVKELLEKELKIGRVYQKKKEAFEKDFEKRWAKALKRLSETLFTSTMNSEEMQKQIARITDWQRQERMTRKWRKPTSKK